MISPARVAVVGAGTMGWGIAHAFLVSGHDVLLIDPSAAARDGAQKTIAGTLSEGVKRGKIDEAHAAKAMERLATAEAVDARCSDADLLVETVVEDVAVKQGVFVEADRHLPASALIATNTSALSISEIAASVGDPGRVIGMHFFNPVPKMKLVELVRGIETRAETVASAVQWVGRIGKDYIVVNEAPGFTTSRMSALMGNEAMYMLAEGVASAEDIDKALRMAFNHPLGPLELGDLTGWDTRLKVLQHLQVVMGERFRPCPLIIKMVKSGRHGRKAGRGVYHYDGDGARVPGSGLSVS